MQLYWELIRLSWIVRTADGQRLSWMLVDARGIRAIYAPRSHRIPLDSLIPEPEQRKDRRWGTKIMAVADRYGLRSEVGRFTLCQIEVPEAPHNLAGDNAYDSDKLNSEL